MGPLLTWAHRRFADTGDSLQILTAAAYSRQVRFTSLDDGQKAQKLSPYETNMSQNVEQDFVIERIL
jgi:hypothetical protein